MKVAVTCLLAPILVPTLTSKILKISAELFHEKGTKHFEFLFEAIQEEFKVMCIHNDCG